VLNGRFFLRENGESINKSTLEALSLPALKAIAHGYHALTSFDFDRQWADQVHHQKAAEEQESSANIDRKRKKEAKTRAKHARRAQKAATPENSGRAEVIYMVFLRNLTFAEAFNLQIKNLILICAYVQNVGPARAPSTGRCD